MRRMITKMISTIEYAKHSRFTNSKAGVMKPIANRLKPNTSSAISDTMPNSTTALMAPEIICATTYSVIDNGVMNMLVRLRDQTFQLAAASESSQPALLQAANPSSTPTPTPTPVLPTPDPRT